MSRDESRDAGSSGWHVARAVLGLLITCAVVFGPVSSAAADINQPMITAANPVAAGNVLYVEAILQGIHEPEGYAAGGRLNFHAFGPNDPTCSGVYASSGGVVYPRPQGDGTYSSNPFRPVPENGTYYFIVYYSGDAYNNPVQSDCSQPVTVKRATPTITSKASALGSAISDRATLAGGDTPTGGIYFDVYGPASHINGATCTGTDHVTVHVTQSTSGTGNGVYMADKWVGGQGRPANPGFYSQPPNPGEPPTGNSFALGTYRLVAYYGGDQYNLPAVTACGDPNETVTVKGCIRCALTGVAARKPELDFKLFAGANGLKSFSVWLPGGLSFNAKHHPPVPIRGLAVSGGKIKSLEVKGRKLIVTLKKLVGSVSVTLRSPLLNVSKGLSKRVRKHKVKKLTFRITMTNASGESTNLRLTVNPK